MSKLLSANFMRLGKSREFWLCAAATLLITAVRIYQNAESASALAQRGFVRLLDDYYFEFAPYAGAVMAIFISLFLGTEYSDGTIRNKIVVGHTRTNIYLANFFTCLTGSIIITAMWFIGGLPGLYLIGAFEMGLSGVITYFFVAVGIAASLSALFVRISILPRDKARTVVLLLVLWIMLSLAASGVYDRLHEVELNGGIVMIDGEFVMVEDTPNPLYLTGGTRTAFEWLRRILPLGQAVYMMSAEITTPILDIAVSAVVTVVITVAGIFSFRRKDLK